SVAAPGRWAQPLPADPLLGQLVEEPRREVERAAAPQRSRRRVREHEPLAGPGQADVAEAPFLLDALLLDRAHMRKDPLLHADRETGLELEALRVVQGHERDKALGAAHGVLVGVERDLLEESREAGLLGLLLVLLRDPDQLLDVLEPALRLDRPLRLER